MNRWIPRLALAGAALLALSACRSTPMKPVTLAPQVDLARFMGDWYVIANIPTFFEKGAHNALESYRLEPDGTIATTFTFRQDGFDGPPKRYQPRGYVREGGHNAVWGMQFVWPIKADYRIAYVSPDYGLTVVAREKRDHVWIMARQPQIAEDDYQRLLAFVGEQGYDTRLVQKVPQRWEAAK